MASLNLLLPVIAATMVSAIIFNLTEMGVVYGSANLIIPPLVIFLPGATLTTGMIELASMNLISGSSRLLYGAATLFLLFTGIAVGLSISELPSVLVTTFEATVFPWWAPVLGTLLFGTGMFVWLSGSNRDLFWMLLVLYIAMLGQLLGETFFNPYFGAFLGAAFMALGSELIARSPQRTPALVSQMLAFWFLVPGARGLLSVTSFKRRLSERANRPGRNDCSDHLDCTGCSTWHVNRLAREVRPRIGASQPAKGKNGLIPCWRRSCTSS